MKCKKCGSEIKEGNNFCTECGKSVNYGIKSKLRDYKILMIVIAIWLICMIIFTSLKINGSKKDTTTIDKNTALEDTINSDENESLNGDSSNVDVSDDEIDVNVEDKQEHDEQEHKEESNDDKTSTNKQENSNNSNSEDKQTSNSNNQNTNNNLDNNEDDIEDNVQDEEDDKLIVFSHKQLTNKTEQELKDLLTSKGLVPKVVSKTEEIAYSDDLANTTKSTVELQLGNEDSNFYDKGDTVEIINTYYKPISWTANLYYNVVGNASFNVFGKTCYAYTGASDKNYGVFCFRENPTELDTFDLLHGGGARGVELYVDGKHIGNGKGYYEFTFNNVETITFKAVAPYVYEYNEDGSERTVLGTDVVVYEKKLNVKELYKNMSGDTIELEIK